MFVGIAPGAIGNCQCCCGAAYSERTAPLQPSAFSPSLCSKRTRYVAPASVVGVAAVGFSCRVTPLGFEMSAFESQSSCCLFFFFFYSQASVCSCASKGLSTNSRGTSWEAACAAWWFAEPAALPDNCLQNRIKVYIVKWEVVETTDKQSCQCSDLLNDCVHVGWKLSAVKETC